MQSLRRFVVALSIAAVPCLAAAQEPPTGGQEPPQGGGRGGRAQEPEIRPYDRVITKDAKSDEGVFTVHRIKDRLYYEIPKERLGREFLWVSQIAKTTLGAGYGGQAAGNRVVKWERRGDRILLRAVSYDVVADAAMPIARAVDAANYDPIVMAFNIEALGKDDAAVIDVTRLFTTDVPEFSGRTRVGRANLRRLPLVRRARGVVPREHRTSRRPTPTTTPPQEAAAAAAAAPRRARVAVVARSSCVPAPPAWSCTTAWCCCPRSRCSRGCSTSASATSRSVRSTTARTSIARPSAATSRGGGWKRRIRQRQCPSR